MLNVFGMRLGKSKQQNESYESNGTVYMIPTEDIMANPTQPRCEFSYEKLLVLAQSISENGIIQPITVVFKNGRPVLVAGERRLRAAKIAGLPEVPCIEVKADGAQAALITLLENLQREDLNCFETAEGIRRLITEYALTQEQAADKLGCSQPSIANKLRLLRLSADERKQIITEGLSERHARALLRIDDYVARQDLLLRVIRDKSSVAQTERMAEEIIKGRSSTRKKAIPLVRDVRLFLNTVNHAVDTMRRSGIKASAEKTETAEYIEYLVRIPKKEAVMVQKSGDGAKTGTAFADE